MLAMAIDIGDGFAAEGIGQVFLLVNLVMTAQDRLCIGVGIALGFCFRFLLRIRDKIGMRAAREAKEFVKAALDRIETIGRAQMPLADKARGIAGRLQGIGDGCLGQRQADVVASSLGWSARIEFVAETLLIAPGQQSGPGRAAIRARHVTARESRARFGQGVEMGRGNILTPLKTGIGIAQVVGHDHQHVGLARRDLVIGVRRTGHDEHRQRAGAQAIWSTRQAWSWMRRFEKCRNCNH